METNTIKYRFTDENVANEYGETVTYQSDCMLHLLDAYISDMVDRFGYVYGVKNARENLDIRNAVLTWLGRLDLMKTLKDNRQPNIELRFSHQIDVDFKPDIPSNILVWAVVFQMLGNDNEYDRKAISAFGFDDKWQIWVIREKPQELEHDMPMRA